MTSRSLFHRLSCPSRSSLALATAASAQAEKLRTVDFKTSCSAPAHAQVNRAVALLHSFSLDPAVKGFTEAAQTDPSCGIAYWGVAMAWMGNPWRGPPSARGLKEGGVAVERAKTAGAKTQRERDYIAAVELVLPGRREGRPHNDARHRLRARPWSSSAQRYPDDREAAIFYALGAQHDARPERQDLRQPAQGRRRSSRRSSPSSRTILASRTT